MHLGPQYTTEDHTVNHTNNQYYIIMKKFAKYLLTLGVAAFSFAACEEEQLVEPVAYTISGDAAFTNNRATVKVTADKAAPEDVTLLVKLDVSSTLPAANLEFPATIKVAKGDTEVSAVVSLLNAAALDAGEYTAVFCAELLDKGPVTEKISIKYSKADLKGKWTVIGTINGTNWDQDFEMTEGTGGWYSVAGIDARDKGTEFKFRRDGSWALAFGVPFKNSVAVGEEFDVIDTEGAPNIILENEGVYTLSVNPNHKKAKVERTGDVVYTYSFSGASAFDETTYKAALKASCDKPVNADVTVALAVDAEKTTFPDGTLSVPASIKIEKGKMEGTADVAIVKDPGYGEFTVVINATIGKDALGSVTLSVKKDIPVMTIKDLRNLIKSGSSNVSFIGNFSNVYVTYRTGSLAYLEDATAAIVYWADNMPIPQAGLKLSGIIEGMVKDAGGGSGNIIPQINYIKPERIQAVSITTASAEEMPKPVTGPISSITANFDDVICKIVKLEGVTAGTNIAGWQNNLITDDSGSFYVYPNYKVNKTINKGYKFSVCAPLTYQGGKAVAKSFKEDDLYDIQEPVKELTIKNVYVKTTDADGIWNQAFSTSSDFRSLAIDDEHIYLAEFNGSKNIWALDLKDPTKYTKLPVGTVESVSGYSIYTSCPRVMKNTNTNINGGKDVLLVSNLGSGSDYRLYVYSEGIDKDPSVITLSGSGRLGDTFTPYGTFDKGILFYAKNGGNGVVTFQMNGVATGTRYLVNRLAMTSDAACSYYPYPESFTSGVLAKRAEARGLNVVVDATETQIWDTWDTAFNVTETQLEYAEGRNGFVEGYNFIEFHGKRYVIYGKRQSAKEGRVYILEGALTDSWLDIINKADVKYRRDFTCTGGNGSTHSGLDVTARVIGDELYIAAVYQHVGLGVWKMLYE